MLKSIDLMYQAMLAELGQRSLDAAWSADFPSDGRFTPLTVKQRRYWYFDRPDGKGGRTRDYVGPASDPEIAKRVEEFKAQKGRPSGTASNGVHPHPRRRNGCAG